MFLRSKISPKKMALTGEAVEEARVSASSHVIAVHTVQGLSRFSSWSRWYVLQRSSLLSLFFSVVFQFFAFNGTVFLFFVLRNLEQWHYFYVTMLQFFYRFYV